MERFRVASSLAVELTRKQRLEQQDDRRMVRALALALLAHSLLILVRVPAAAPPERSPARPADLFRVRPVRIVSPRTPAVPEDHPHRWVRRIPVPTPLAEPPEPVRPILPDVSPFDLPAPDALVAGFEIPASPPAAGVDHPLPVGGDVQAPVKLFAPSPRYPELARRARVEGAVVLKTVIDARGRVTDVEVLRSAPFGLTEAAVEAVGRWRFAPGTLRGKPVPVVFNLTVTFSLH